MEDRGSPTIRGSQGSGSWWSPRLGLWGHAAHRRPGEEAPDSGGEGGWAETWGGGSWPRGPPTQRRRHAETPEPRLSVRVNERQGAGPPLTTCTRPRPAARTSAQAHRPPAGSQPSGQQPRPPPPAEGPDHSGVSGMCFHPPRSSGLLSEYKIASGHKWGQDLKGGPCPPTPSPNGQVEPEATVW